jgi:hypothetical protein
VSSCPISNDWRGRGREGERAEAASEHSAQASCPPLPAFALSQMVVQSGSTRARDRAESGSSHGGAQPRLQARDDSEDKSSGKRYCQFVFDIRKIKREVRIRDVLIRNVKPALVMSIQLHYKRGVKRAPKKSTGDRTWDRLTSISKKTTTARDYRLGAMLAIQSELLISHYQSLAIPATARARPAADRPRRARYADRGLWSASAQRSAQSRRMKAPD